MEISTSSEPQDRLSELPDSVIFHIFWFLPMRYVVQTTILSKRWRNLWTTAPCLNFHDHDDEAYHFDIEDPDRFRSFVSRALLRWNGVRILKFRVSSSCSKLHKRIYGDSELYAYLAKEKRAEEFYLHLPFETLKYYDSARDVYSVPQCLYSCSSLKLLSLRFSYFRFNGGVSWSLLKSLTVTKCFGVNEHLVNQILCGSPKLEVLSLCFVEEGQNLNIRSDSLKELRICKYLLDFEFEFLVSELTIWTPNLEALTIEGIPFANCRLVNVKSSAHVTIGFYGANYNDYNDCNFGMDRKDFTSSQDYIADRFHQVLTSIEHFERVTLFYCCLKVLGVMKERCIGSTFPNVKSIEIGNYSDVRGELVGMLDIFPQLKRLVLQDGRTLHFFKDRGEIKCRVSSPRCLLPQLRTIEVIWSRGDYIFASIEILLKYASKLEKMVFRVGRHEGYDSLCLASDKLQKMSRSSANCNIDILQE